VSSITPFSSCVEPAFLSKLKTFVRLSPELVRSVNRTYLLPLFIGLREFVENVAAPGVKKLPRKKIVFVKFA
jgi:hypothetical protein